MDSFDPSEQERLQNWRALQVELGLIPDEAIVPVPEADATAVREEAIPVAEATHASDSPNAERPAEVSATSAEEMPTEYPLADSGERDVEVGEAPEEIPDEPGDELAAPEKKRRRRRRRRRKGEASVDGATPEKEASGVEAPAVTLEGEGSADSEPSDLEGDDEETVAEEDEEEIEPISLPDWNVPTWQELIDSLYRPER